MANLPTNAPGYPGYLGTSMPSAFTPHQTPQVSSVAPPETQANPDAFKALILSKYPNGVAADGTKYADMSANELTQKIVGKYPDGVTSDGRKYADFLPPNPDTGTVSDKSIPLSTRFGQSVINPIINTVTNLGTNYLNQANDAVHSGFDMMKQGFNDAYNGNPLEGVLTSGAGAITVPAALVSPVLGAAMYPFNKGVENLTQPLNNNPSYQKFAMSPAGQTTSRVVNDANNLNTIVGGVAGGIDMMSEKPTVIPAIVNEGKNLASDAGTLADSALNKLTPNPADVPKAIDPTVQGRIDTLHEIEMNSAPLRRLTASAKSRGIDVPDLVANTDLLQGSVDANGKIDTLSKGHAVDQFNQYMNKYESAVSDGLAKEGISIPLDKVKIALNDAIKNSKAAGSSKTRLINLANDEISGLQHDINPNGSISLSKLQDAKISTTNGIDYTRPETKINAKIIADVYRTIIEDNSKLPVKDINAELSKYYSIGDYLEALNGKGVKGSKLGKYMAQTIGGMAGSHFGPLGTIIGSELGKFIKGTSFESTFGKAIGNDLEPSPLLQQQIKDNSAPPIQLPGKVTEPPQSPLNLPKNQNTPNKPTPNNNIDIPPKPTSFTPKSQVGKAIQQTAQDIKNTPNKQGGFARIPSSSYSDTAKSNVAKELNDFDTSPLKVNGKLDLSNSDAMFRLDQLKTISEKRDLTNAETAEANKLLAKYRPKSTVFGRKNL